MTTPLEMTDSPLSNASVPSALAELNRIRAAMPEILNQATEQLNTGTLPFLYWGAGFTPFQRLTSGLEDNKWFFIGDIHGDFFALHTLLEEVSKHPNAKVCFLGDLVDRGPHGLECFARLLEFAENQRAANNCLSVVWVLGNHDEGISINPRSENKFFSTVDPAEFVDFLNGDILSQFEEAELTAWGCLFVDACERLPRALLFKTGLLATHGGVPLEDRWPYLKTPGALNHKRCLGDFTWTRASTMPCKTAWQDDPKRRLYSSDFEYGYKDLEGFCEAVKPLFSVKFLVRGHDHVEGGHEIPTNYKAIPLMTLNGFGFHYLSGSFKAYRKNLVMGVSEDGGFPKIVSLPIAQDSFEEFVMNEKIDATP